MVFGIPGYKESGVEPPVLIGISQDSGRTVISPGTKAFGKRDRNDAFIPDKI